MEPINLIKKHCKFGSDFDVYVLFGIARKKDNLNITNSQEVVFREVIKEEENIEKKYTKLKTQCENYRNIDGKKLNFYIYISVNSRDVRKGYIAFKSVMLKYEREILFGVPCHNQLKRLDAIWLSAIMKPESRSKENRRFMMDIDTKDSKCISRVKKELDNFGIEIVLKQETKNGHHWIITPYDRSRGNGYSFVEVKTDALFFIEHIRGD